MPTITDEVTALDRLVWVDPERMSGAPCFRGTRVPIQHLFDYLEGGSSLEEFLEDFEGITREQAQAVIHLSMEGLLKELQHA